MECKEVNTSKPQAQEMVLVITTIGFEFVEIVRSTTNGKQFGNVETN